MGLACYRYGKKNAAKVRQLKKKQSEINFTASESSDGVELIEVSPDAKALKGINTQESLGDTSINEEVQIPLSPGRRRKK